MDNVVAKIAGRSFYKFLDKQHVNAFLSGSIKLGGFDTYSLLEIITADKWIGDREESRAVTRLDTIQRPGLFIRDSNVFMFTYGYCLSLSSGRLSALQDAMINSKSPYRYDACVQISDINELTWRIAKALETKYSNFRDMGFEVDHVTYEDGGNSHDANDFDDIKAHNFFSKPARYSDQREFRLAVTMARDDQTHNYLMLDIGDISDIAHEVAVAIPATEWTDPFRMNVDQANAEIGLVLEALAALDANNIGAEKPLIERLVYAYGCLRVGNGQMIRADELDRSIVFYDVDRDIKDEDRGLPWSMHGQLIVKFFMEKWPDGF